MPALSLEQQDVAAAPAASVSPGKVVVANPNVPVELPQLRYGYRTTKATWDELVNIINVEKNIPKMSRSHSQQHDYEVFRYHMKQQYASSVDYILISKFGFLAVDCYSDDNRGKHQWRAKPSLSEIKSSQKILVENDFPYYIEDHIRHYVLWKTKEAITEEEIEQAKEELCSKHQAADDILYWVNPPNLQSLPEIDHVHFLCKVNNTNDE